MAAKLKFIYKKSSCHYLPEPWSVMDCEAAQGRRTVARLVTFIANRVSCYLTFCEGFSNVVGPSDRVQKANDEGGMFSSSELNERTFPRQ